MQENAKNLIYEIRDKKVILVRDLARLYGYKNGTKTINLTIKRNIEKFSSENYFQLTSEEYDNLWFQCETAKEGLNMSRTLPFVLTKEGILTLSKLLKKENIKEINSKILENFDNQDTLINNIRSYQILPNNQGKIENLIYEINGVQVMLDSDLAILYGCKNGTKEINQAVKNNIEKFPLRYSWILSDKESETFLVKNFDQKNIETRGGKYKNPRVFTEQGVTMLSTVLKSQVATQISIQIMDAFVNMRHFIKNNQELFANILNIYSRLDKQDYLLEDITQKVALLFSKFESNDYKELVFFDGQIYDAYSKILDILNLAKEELIIVDSYADKKVLDMISNLKVKVTLITMKDRNLKQSSIDNYNKQYNNLNVIYDYSLHDRYIIIDNSEIYHLGASLTGAGKKMFSINKIEDMIVKDSIINKLAYNLT